LPPGLKTALNLTRSILVAVVLILWLVKPPAVRAQSASATLSGTISDTASATVPNAKVSAKNVATGQIVETLTDSSGRYAVPNLGPGDYELSVSAPGFSTNVSTVTLLPGSPKTFDIKLGGALSLGDLGFSSAQAQGSAQDQARLDKRSHMLKIHQRLGLITTAPLLATLFSSGFAAGKMSTPAERDVHAALGSTTASLYIATAYFAIFAPRIPGAHSRGQIRLHKAMAFIHGPGMILTPILGAMALDQRNNGEKVHGIASAHSTVAAVTAVAYGIAILSVSIKF
jgi:hypothetical protein